MNTNAEQRVAHASISIERRRAAPPADADGGDESAEPSPVIVGHASVFDEFTTLYEGRYWVWREVIRPGAFKRAIAAGQDVRSLFNHDSNIVLGRTKSGTLELTEDAKGLLTRTYPPPTQTVNDLVVVPMERGDIDGMSFAFSVVPATKTVHTTLADGSEVVESDGERVTYRYQGDCLIEEREVLDADLFDISPVTYPAYSGTSVGLRSLGPDIEARAKEMDRPHARPAPKRDQYRRRLDEAAALPSKAV